MATVDYQQTVEDHQSFLVLIRLTGKHLSGKHFSRCWDRICQLDYVTIPGQKRDMWIRYKKSYSRERNEWGDFQAHRKVLGLISVGKCSTEKEFEDLFDSYRKEKEEFADTLFNSRLVVFGMNPDGSQLSEEQTRHIEEMSSAEPLALRIDDNLNTASCDNTNNSNINSSSYTNTVALENNRNSGSDSPKLTSVSEHVDPLRKDVKSVMTNGKSVPKTVVPAVEAVKKQAGHQRSPSNTSKDMSGSEVVFYPSFDNSDSLEESVREFVTSLFFVLEGKRLDRGFERQDKAQLLCAPFEKKDYVGIDPDSRSYKKKCQGRLRKHLADLCLQAGLPGEAMLHYNTSIDILKPVNDWLWMGACYEGLCAASVMTSYHHSQPAASALALRRNKSFSTKRGVANIHDKVRSGSIKHAGSYANGLQDMPDMAGKSGLNVDDIIDKYRETLVLYNKYKNAALIEMEASLKACRILIVQRKYLPASDFLQNVVYINLQLSDEDRIIRYSTLSTLYAEIGFQRKASFFKRVAAMQCVAPQNPKPNWHLCHQLLIQTLPGYRIHLNPKDRTLKAGEVDGWPVIQTRVLHELIYSARRMGNLPLAIRYTTLMLYLLLDDLSVQEKREVIASLESLTTHCEGTTQPLVLESGLIIPAISLLNVPQVKSFKLMPLHQPLEPKPVAASETTCDHPFIFTPLNLGPVNNDTVKTDVDFCWVEGDNCEVQLQMINPLPDDLKLVQLGLLTDGLEVETFPAGPTISPGPAPCLVRVMCRPTAAGDLSVLGYSTKVFGVRNNCRLRDLPNIPQSHFKVKVVPALPRVELSSSLPKSASFLSFGEEFNVVTSGSMAIYAGQSCECEMKLENVGRLPIEMVRINLECARDTKAYVQEVFQWSPENIQSQLPLTPSSRLCFNLNLHGVNDFLPSTVTCKESPGNSLESIERQGSHEGKCVEAIMKFEYSGGPGLVDGYCRCCSVAFTIDILPSVVFHSWDVMAAESSDHCCLLFDLENISGHEIEVQYSTQCVHLRHQQIRRICVQIERCPSMVLGSQAGGCSGNRFSQYLATFVDIRWSIPSLKVAGKAGIEHLTWSPGQQQIVFMSPVEWEVKLNDQLFSPLHIGSLDYHVGDRVNVEVEVNVKPDVSTLDYDSGVFSIRCCQHCDNGVVSYNTSHQVAPLGAATVLVPKICADIPILHSCTFLFTSCGFYRFEISMKVKSKGHDEVKGSQTEAKGQTDNVQIWKCLSVIEVQIGN